MLGADELDDLGRRHDVLEPPAVRRSDIHVLDEAQDRARSIAEELRHRHHVGVVHPALHDHVDLDRREPGRERSVDALEHALDRERDVVDRLERLVVERVERDGHALQSGIGEALGLAREQGAVRGERDVGDAVDRHEALDQTLELAPQERLAARQADLLDAVGGERRRDALDLLEREQCGAVEELEVLAEHLARHAVDAAEVAAVGDRDAEVTEAASEQVDGLCGHESMVTGRLFQKPARARVR